MNTCSTIVEWGECLELERAEHKGAGLEFSLHYINELPVNTRAQIITARSRLKCCIRELD